MGRITWSGKKQDRDCPLSAAARHCIISATLFKQPLWEVSFRAKFWPQETWGWEQTHSPLFGVSGKQDFWEGFLCYAISSKAELPVSDASQTAAKRLQNRSHGSLMLPHSFVFKGRDIGKINGDPSAKYAADMPRETSNSITFFPLLGGTTKNIPDLANSLSQRNNRQEHVFGHCGTEQLYESPVTSLCCPLCRKELPPHRTYASTSTFLNAPILLPTPALPALTHPGNNLQTHRDCLRRWSPAIQLACTAPRFHTSRKEV